MENYNGFSGYVLSQGGTGTTINNSIANIITNNVTSSNTITTNSTYTNIINMANTTGNYTLLTANILTAGNLYLNNETVNTSYINQATIGNLNISTLYSQGNPFISTQWNNVLGGISYTSGTCTILNLLAINQTESNTISTNETISNIYAMYSTFGSSLITDCTASNMHITNLTSTNQTSNNLLYVTAGNFYANNSTVQNVIVGNEIVANSLTTNSTTTNLKLSNETVSNSIITNLYVTNLTTGNFSENEYDFRMYHTNIVTSGNAFSLGADANYPYLIRSYQTPAFTGDKNYGTLNLKSGNYILSVLGLSSTLGSGLSVEVNNVTVGNISFTAGSNLVVIRTIGNITLTNSGIQTVAFTSLADGTRNALGSYWMTRSL